MWLGLGGRKSRGFRQYAHHHGGDLLGLVGWGLDEDWTDRTLKMGVKSVL